MQINILWNISQKHRYIPKFGGNLLIQCSSSLNRGSQVVPPMQMATSHHSKPRLVSDLGINMDFLDASVSRIDIQNLKYYLHGICGGWVRSPYFKFELLSNSNKFNKYRSVPITSTPPNQSWRSPKKKVVEFHVSKTNDVHQFLMYIIKGIKIMHLVIASLFVVQNLPENISPLNVTYFVTIFFQGTTHWHTASCQVRFVPNVGARSVHAAAPVRPGARHRSSALASCEGGAPPKPPWPLADGCGMEGWRMDVRRSPWRRGIGTPKK